MKTKISRLIFISLFFVGCNQSTSVHLVKVTKGRIQEIVTGVSSGTVVAEKDAELAFGAVGRINILNVSKGDFVKKDSILAELENEDMKSAYHTAVSELERLSSLKGFSAISKTTLDEAKRSVAINKSALEKTIIKAPFDGFVADQSLEIGQLAQITAVIPAPPIRLIDSEPRYVSVQIDEIDLQKITINMPAIVKIPSVRREPFNGTVRRVIPYINSTKEQDRTALVEININTDMLLTVGASSDVEIILQSKNDILLLPARAILGQRKDKFVYSVENGRIHKIHVEVGISNYDSAEIINGLKEGDAVVLPDVNTALTEKLKVTALED